MAELELRCLGGLELTLAGTPLVALRSAKAKALLGYLAVSGRQHSRTALAGLFWSDLPEEDARANLRVVLTKLRHAVPEHLEVSHESVAFNHNARYRLDVETFLGKFRNQVAPIPAKPQTLGSLHEAAELYRGDFLEGFNVPNAPLFEEWLAGERERFRYLALQALHTLAAHYTQRHDYTTGIDYLTRLLRLDPWREEGHRQLMWLFALSGQRESALAQFETCRSVLNDAFGAKPTPETVALARSIELREVEAKPPLAARYNLPKPPTSLLGRDDLLGRLAAQLVAGTRLLTLTGPGGVGKTRLALELAWTLRDDFADGAYLVSLAAINDVALVAAAITQALELREGGKQSAKAQLKDHLQDKETLLLLDNFEHLLPAATLVAELLAYCPNLKVVATSRTPLHLRGEREASTVPLPIPEVSLGRERRGVRAADLDLGHEKEGFDQAELETLTSYPSVALFCERAQGVNADFTLTPANARAVAQICIRLDGLPLAIELAAARSKLLSPEAIAARLDQRLQLLTYGAADLPKRHQTLRETLSWSYELLTKDEQRLFRRLGVAVGGSSLSLAVALGGQRQRELEVLETLGSLTDKSLLQRVAVEDGDPRVEMLETVREYALEKLAEDLQEQAQSNQAHAQYFLTLAEEKAERVLTGPEKALWLAVLATERDNLRVALGWAEAQGENELGLRLIAALGRFWLIQGHVVEGRDWSARLLAVDETSAEHVRADVRAAALTAAAWFAHAHDDFRQASIWFEESAALRVDCGQTAELAAQLVNEAMQARAEGNYARATTLLEESLARHRDADNRQSIGQDGLGLSLARLGLVLAEQGRYTRATELYDECLRLHQTLGDRGGVAATLLGLSDIARDQGDFVPLRELCEACLRAFRDLGEQWGVGFALNNLALAAYTEGALSRAAALVAESLSVLSSLQSAAPSAEVLATVAYIALAQGERRRAGEALTESLTLARASGPRWLVAVGLEGVADLLLEAQPGRAAELLGAAAALRRVMGVPLAPFRQANQKRVHERGQTLLGEDAWQRAFYPGSKLPPEQAVEVALARAENVTE